MCPDPARGRPDDANSRCAPGEGDCSYAADAGVLAGRTRNAETEIVMVCNFNR